MPMYPESRPVQLEYSSEREVSMFRFFNQVYAWMFVGLAVTALVAYLGSTSSTVLHLLGSMRSFGWIAITLGMWGLATAATNSAMRISAALGLTLFLLYAALTGVLLSAIFVIFPIATLASSFVVTAGVFAGMSLVGFVIKKDLSTIGRIAIMCVWGVMLASFVNMFVANTAVDWAITYAVLGLFIILTAYRTQMLKQIANDFAYDPKMLNRAAVVGSLLLYISFINLFMSILRILGSRK